jgi:hypothetical protein
MGYNYSDSQVTKRASSGGKDGSRKAQADQLFAQATQPPHDDDAYALQKLEDFSGVSHPGEMGWATADARNYGKMLLGRLDPSFQPQYDKAHDGGFSLGHTLGGILKVAAPVAGALIPGLGTLGAMAVGGLGSAAGGVLSGDKFNLGKTLGAAGAAAAGNNLLGNGLGGGTTNLGFGSTPSVAQAPDIGGMGQQGGIPGAVPKGYAGYSNPQNPTNLFPGAGGAPYTPGAGAAANAAYHAALPQSPMSKLGKFAGDLFKDDKGHVSLDKIGMVAGGAAKLYGAQQQRSAQNRVMNANLDLQRRGMDMAQQGFDAMQPMRDMAMQRLGRLGRSNSIFSYGAA